MVFRFLCSCLASEKHATTIRMPCIIFIPLIEIVILSWKNNYFFLIYFFFPILRALNRKRISSGSYHISLISTRTWRSVMPEHLVLAHYCFLCYHTVRITEGVTQIYFLMEIEEWVVKILLKSPSTLVLYHSIKKFR